MKLKLLLSAPLVLSLVMTGCNRSDAPAGAAEEPVAAPVSQSAPAPTSTRDTLAIGAGFALPRGFSMRSKSTSGEGTDAAHVARAEFQGSTREAGNVLRRSFDEAGFQQVSESEDAEGVATRIFRSADGQRVRVVFAPKGPALKIELQVENAEGLATFYWQDAAAPN